MPLIKSSSPGAFKQNVRTLMGEVGKSPHVQSRQQALAIAYSERRRAKKRASGGSTREPPVNSPDFDTWHQAWREDPQSMGMRTYPGQDAQLDPYGGTASGFSSRTPSVNWLLKDVNTGQARGGAVAKRRAFGGKLTPGESMPHARMHEPFHVGPILSAVPGRTDHHGMSVPAGSYVFPADHVNSLGQGNSVAGLAKLHARFPSPHMPHGHGPPQPKMAGLGAAAGGVRGGLGSPVPIMAAGGEFVVHPHHVLKLGGGDIKRGHEMLDREVMQQRKKHIKTLKSLPAPAKS